MINITTEHWKIMWKWCSVFLWASSYHARWWCSSRESQRPAGSAACSSSWRLFWSFSNDEDVRKFCESEWSRVRVYKAADEEVVVSSSSLRVVSQVQFWASFNRLTFADQSVRTANTCTFFFCLLMSHCPALIWWQTGIFQFEWWTSFTRWSCPKLRKGAGGTTVLIQTDFQWQQNMQIWSEENFTRDKTRYFTRATTPWPV